MVRSNVVRGAMSVCLFVLLALLTLGLARAQMEVKSAGLTAGEDAYLLSADALIELNATLEEAIARGVGLHFATEFELTRPRWYWFDETIAARTFTYRLSYHALTRQYRLSTGALHQSFASLPEAVGVLARIRERAVFDRAQVKPGDTYQAALRVRLDLSLLPKPIQVSAIGAREWNLASEWYRWTFVPEREAR